MWYKNDPTVRGLGNGLPPGPGVDHFKRLKKRLNFIPSHAAKITAFYGFRHVIPIALKNEDTPCRDREGFVEKCCIQAPNICTFNLLRG
jgi:hypothetical protein